jgi:hypothetical protein
MIADLKEIIVESFAHALDRERGQIRKLFGQEIAHLLRVDQNFGIGPRHVHDVTDAGLISPKRSSGQRVRRSRVRETRLK